MRVKLSERTPSAGDGIAFLITTESAESTEMSGRDVTLYNKAFFKKALL